MYTRVIPNRQLGPLTVRPLLRGDTETVAAVFDRLGPESRARRFNGAKPRLSTNELEQIAAVDQRRHALVAYVDRDPQPVGIAELVRDCDQWAHAEIAFAVADRYQGLGVGSTLVELLAADARAAGITHLTATMRSSNAAAHALVRKVASSVDVKYSSGEAMLVAALEAA
jgi:ribosomal protein S18 acetylase RimI-like enzyme